MSAAPEPACVVRGMLAADGRVRLVTRNLAFAAEGQTSLPAQASHPSALDLLVAALASDVLAGFRREAARAGVAIGDAELRVAATLDNPLVALGVVGERGSPALAGVRGTLYVSGDGDPDAFDPLLAQALARAPVFATLSRAADVRIALELST